MNANDHSDGKSVDSSSKDMNVEQTDLTQNTQGRRNALNKIGRYSAYIAPAMLAMFSTQAHAS